MRRLLYVTAASVLLTGLLLMGCEDDPILGPTDEEPDGGGSYGRIQQLPPAPVDTVHIVNPDRF